MFLLANLLAMVFLAKMMRGRQAQLVTLLREYSEKQIEWSRKKARAAKLARETAAAKAAEEARATTLEFPDSDSL